MLSKFSSLMRQFNAWKGVMAFLAWPVTTDNCVRIFCHLRWMRAESSTLPHFVLSFLAWPVTTDNCVRIFYHLRWMCAEPFTLPHFVLSCPMKTTVSSVYFTAAAVIFCGILHTRKSLSIYSIQFIFCHKIMGCVLEGQNFFTINAGYSHNGTCHNKVTNVLFILSFD
jgi:hypothetical protein